jgi:recombinational DNA repair ATPase RecF
MSSVIADGVLAATHKLVQQAMTGQWQDVPKTVQERRELLNNLSASASPQDQQWLGALQQAMAESDAAVAQMAANAPATLNASQGSAEATDSGVTDTPNTAAVDSMMEMLKKSR